MENVLGYYIFSIRDGGLWAKGGGWTSRFSDAVEYDSLDKANAILQHMVTAHPEAATVYVMACMGLP